MRRHQPSWAHLRDPGAGGTQRRRCNDETRLGQNRHFVLPSPSSSLASPADTAAEAAADKAEPESKMSASAAVKSTSPEIVVEDASDDEDHGADSNHQLIDEPAVPSDDVYMNDETAAEAVNVEETSDIPEDASTRVFDSLPGTTAPSLPQRSVVRGTPTINDDPVRSDPIARQHERRYQEANLLLGLRNDIPADFMVSVDEESGQQRGPEATMPQAAVAWQQGASMGFPKLAPPGFERPTYAATRTRGTSTSQESSTARSHQSMQSSKSPKSKSSSTSSDTKFSTGVGGTYSDDSSYFSTVAFSEPFSTLTMDESRTAAAPSFISMPPPPPRPPFIYPRPQRPSDMANNFNSLPILHRDRISGGSSSGGSGSGSANPMYAVEDTLGCGGASGDAVGQRRGLAWKPLHPGCPKDCLHAMYGKPPRNSKTQKNDYYTFYQGQDHNRKFTSIFVCPLTGECFCSARYGPSTNYTCLLDPATGHSVVWYGKKVWAEHGAAARAFDCFSLRETPDHLQPEYVGDDEPYATPHGWPLPSTTPRPLLEAIERLRAEKTDAAMDTDGGTRTFSPHNLEHDPARGLFQ